MLPVDSSANRQRLPRSSLPTSSTTSTAVSLYVSTAVSQPPSSSTAIAESKLPRRCIRDFLKRFFITPKHDTAFEITMLRRYRMLAGIGLEDSSNLLCVCLDSDSESDYECAYIISTSSERSVSNHEREGPHSRLSHSSNTPSKEREAVSGAQHGTRPPPSTTFVLPEEPR
ncbi:hypothetical protein PIB30_083965 [Stylosanthes scabra]|uniref:Uncharacterized protein n=1 Tax=Stylosanthes scabra TaxID=79078 RepID=A0ABU6YT73_9FABA|nr:hypothetical protein [Stylosanthes scabra]